jgi:2-polyprenyl-3-methyl-5-hydroxy-6-metoxy-1,4-benzoquinol methylase
MTWYEALFRNYAETYEKEEYIQGTLAEVDFIEKEIKFDKSKRILDIGCGTGRHAVELAKRGYAVTGIDLSEAMLKKAAQKAETAGVKVEFKQQDARKLPFHEEFDLAIMICEGAFPLMETDEMNFAILKGAYNSLKKDGKFIFTTLNGLYPLFHSVKDFLNKETSGATVAENNFDLMTFRDYSVFETTDDSGNAMTLHCNERYYVPSEISWLLKSLGFRQPDIFGATLGAFSREDKLATDNFEMLVIAEK